MKQAKIIVSGKVQGVGFRYYTRKKAEQLGVRGYVQNLKNGNVEIVTVGETKLVDALIEWARSGSPSAVVNDLNFEVIQDTGEQYQGFEIRR
ncbi:acylphosphatase [Pleurocapsa sp. FMAR1]|uniref:acylphosphatase n=1 Tax=Pleurocapsa sp. FMAR1 TaxID=3040204 RepID=UPI0029C8209F|nr:acylphosphatase [Pleurocapsa sp. FMAR1]